MGIITDNATWDDLSQANLITPPVIYGVSPARTEQFAVPATLRPGATYDVNLARVVPAGSTAPCLTIAFGNFCLMAIHEFTR